MKKKKNLKFYRKKDIKFGFRASEINTYISHLKNDAIHPIRFHRNAHASMKGKDIADKQNRSLRCCKKTFVKSINILTKYKPKETVLYEYICVRINYCMPFTLKKEDSILRNSPFSCTFSKSFLFY